MHAHIYNIIHTQVYTYTYALCQYVFVHLSKCARWLIGKHHQRKLHAMTTRNVKTCIPEENRKGFAYEVSCKYCRKFYDGETKRTLKVRLRKHRQAVKRGDPRIGIAVYAHNTQHAIDWMGQEGSQLLVEENH